MGNETSTTGKVKHTNPLRSWKAVKHRAEIELETTLGCKSSNTWPPSVVKTGVVNLAPTFGGN